jgi:trimeric autotransporter adhesin
VIAVPSNVTAGTPFTLKVSVLDAYGNEVKNYFGTIHFADTAGLAGLPPDYTFTGADAGVHSFTVTLNTAGNQTLSATDTANPSLKGTTLVNVKSSSGGGCGGSGGGGGGTTGGGGGGGGGGSGGGKGSG